VGGVVRRGCVNTHHGKSMSDDDEAAC